VCCDCEVEGDSKLKVDVALELTRKMKGLADQKKQLKSEQWFFSR
jgi:hypothetical protein